jgi:uncharacterized protein (DUF2236 family)
MATAVTELHAVPSSDPESADWALGPGSVSWEVMRNPCVFVVGILREAILLTLHLPFAAAAIDHDGVHEDPVKRFRTIARYAYSATYGTKAEAEHVSGYVRRRHAQVVGIEPVSGEPYRANSDYELVLTQVLLSSSWLAAYETLNGPLPAVKRDQFLLEQKTAGALLGIRPHHLPDSYEQLQAFLADARSRWAAGEQARTVLKPFASGVYPAGSVIGELPGYQRRPVAFLVRMLTDMALSTMSADERDLLAIDRKPQLRSRVAVRKSLEALSAWLRSARGTKVFDGFLKPDVAKVMRRARAAESAPGYPATAAAFVVPDPAPFVVELEDRVENMP